jgi:hypothetical protein
MKRILSTSGIAVMAMAMTAGVGLIAAGVAPNGLFACSHLCSGFKAPPRGRKEAKVRKAPS